MITIFSVEIIIQATANTFSIKVLIQFAGNSINDRTGIMNDKEASGKRKLIRSQILDSDILWFGGQSEFRLGKVLHAQELN